MYVRTKSYSGDQIKKNEMGGACGMHGEEARCIQGFGGKPKGGHGHEWEDGGMDWIDVVQGLDRWQAFVNAIVNFLVP